jgi:glycosyltransferase involved in cell wall biosynthesis
MIDELTNAGTETQLLALIRSLDRSRVVPHLCLLRGASELSRSLEPEDCPVLRLGVRSLVDRRALGAAYRLGQFFRDRRIEVLQVYFPDSTYFGVPIARLAGVGRVVRTRNNVNHWMTPTHRTLGRLLNGLVSVTVANCAASRDAVLADERPDPRSVIVLENGVDLARFPAAAFAGRGGGAVEPRRIGVVANLRPVKGLDVFLHAAAIVARTHGNVAFEVAGDGEQRSELEQLGARLGLSGRLFFRGVVGDIPSFLASLDVAVLSSRAEGMSNAVLEYMAAGRAIVATAVGATSQLIEDATHGLLIPPENPEALAAAIGRLLTDPVLARRLGTAARRRAEEQFSRAAMVKRFEQFFEQLAGRPSHAADLA